MTNVSEGILNGIDFYKLISLQLSLK